MANPNEKDTKVGKNIQSVEEVLGKTEHFIEKHQKIILYIVGALVVIVGGYMAFNKFYLGPKEKEAQSQIFYAERYFEKDSLDLALNGDNNYMGFLDIIDEYGMTKTADLAHYYAGMCYLKKGQFQEAIDQLEDFDGDDVMVSSMAKGAIGDAYMELGDNEKALEYYKKAADDNVNNFTTPMFLMKQGWTYELAGNYDDALLVYERIQKEFYKSYEWREIEKYIARAKALSGKK